MLSHDTKQNKGTTLFACFDVQFIQFNTFWQQAQTGCISRHFCTRLKIYLQVFVVKFINIIFSSKNFFFTFVALEAKIVMTCAGF